MSTSGQSQFPAPKSRSSGRIWGGAVLLTVAIHLFGLWFLVPAGEEPTERTSDTFRITWWPEVVQGSEEALSFLLQETSPLFLPGPWNSPFSGEARWRSRRPEEPFPLEAAIIDAEARALREGVGDFIPGAPTLADVLPLPRQPFLHIWQERSPRMQLALPPRRVYFRSLGRGESVELTQFQPSDPASRPETGTRPATIFRYQHSLMGPIGPLVLQRGSGDEDLDRWRKTLLEREILPTVFLEPGYFFVEIGL